MKFALNLQLQTIQTSTNDVQMLILCLYYLITIYCKVKIIIDLETTAPICGALSLTNFGYIPN